MKKFKQKFNQLNNDGNKCLSDKILLLIVEGVHENSSKLTWLIAVMTIGIAILIALLIKG